MLNKCFDKSIVLLFFPPVPFPHLTFLRRVFNTRTQQVASLLLLVWRQSFGGVHHGCVLVSGFFQLNFKCNPINMRERHFMGLIGRKYGCNCLKQNYFLSHSPCPSLIDAVKSSRTLLNIKYRHLNT